MRSETLKTHLALQDIFDNIILIEKFVGNLSSTQFADDIEKIYSVTRALEIISEASHKLSKLFQDKYTSIPWREVADAGNLYRHQYGDVAPEILWQTITVDLPKLKAVVKKELELLNNA